MEFCRLALLLHNRVFPFGQTNVTELFILVSFGVVATILRFEDYPLAQLLTGFILGTMTEDNFARSM